MGGTTIPRNNPKYGNPEITEATATAARLGSSKV